MCRWGLPKIATKIPSGEGFQFFRLSFTVVKIALIIYNYCTVSSGDGAYSTFIYNIVSHNLQFTFSFQDVNLVC